jgi:hypothetical protein
MCRLRNQIPLPIADVACEQMVEWAPVLLPGVAVTGTVESATGDLWQLTLTEAAAVTITLAAENSDLDTYLILYNPQLQIIEKHDDIELGVIRDSMLNRLLLPEPGIYWIEARRCCPDEDGGSTGAYWLLVMVARVE